MISALLMTAMPFLASADVHVAPELSLGWSQAPASVQASLLSAHEATFTVYVKSQNMDVLKAMVEQVSDPRSPKYTEYMTTAAIQDLTKPRSVDMDTVKQWLHAGGMQFTVDGERVIARGPVARAEALLNTKFNAIQGNGKTLIRAGDYSLPADVEAATASVFGLHGIPLPDRQVLTAPGQPADVTPAVIATTYKVSGVTPAGSTSNRQAVAEFQGQTEEDSDLVQFFKQYVKNAQAGDDKVFAFKGDPNKENPQVEASLDIQYIMGVAPHVKTEFWLFMGSDFCADLVEWTNDLIKAGSDGPNVHSISYGWQGNLTQVGCTMDKVGTIDDNYAKLAMAGISIIFASGDSGSGYAPGNTCQGAEQPNNQMFTGDKEREFAAEEAVQCCLEASGSPFSFLPNKGPEPGNTCQGGDNGKKDVAYTGTARQVFRVPNQDSQICCELSRNSGGLQFTFTPNATGNEGTCTLWASVSGHTQSKGSLSGKGAPGRQAGNCTIFSKVTGTETKSGATSGGNSGPTKVQLWPSWPASSPYITSVGATRFVNQEVGQPEMATDQFGSGGGFSEMFDQTNAKWQQEAVAHYVNNPPNDPHYPPAGSFPKTGRATPDISALGEGYQVVIGGHVEAVGGTSASTPAFAGLVSLLNDARVQKGKKALGFLNPFIYQNVDCWTDVTLGTNAIGRGTGPIKYGFNATEGWDPATGLGTPKFDKLLTAAMNA
jgi:subtilase family serine protease